ncbi:DUF2911 domain-containing protein [Dyadobacter diqingensis]|uniref:DUF2911 domain-containing protein n=1 Tax=Dyadobacter diqingensis TaxID=2938121 RepID=UPI0020C5723A|nr:DUF2911 domain-containing protein [Dyadobacter diqingensis]
MKTNSFILAMMLMASATFKSNAQDLVLPNPSTTQTVIQDLGLGKVSVTYSRPPVKNRKIFGGLVPYGQVWRAGANNATVIKFSEDAIVEGHNIPAGAYALFCIPEKDEWTIILNKSADQWGAYAYNQASDLIRFKVKTIKTAEKQEAFTMLFNNPTTITSYLNISWDQTAVNIHLTTNDDAKIVASIDRIMEKKEVSNLNYFNAIQYYYINNKDTDKALGWIAKAEQDFPKRASYKLFKSRFLLRKGDKAGAQAAAEAGIKTAQEGSDNEYLRLNQEALEQAKR